MGGFSTVTVVAGATRLVPQRRDSPHRKRLSASRTPMHESEHESSVQVRVARLSTWLSCNYKNEQASTQIEPRTYKARNTKQTQRDTGRSRHSETDTERVRHVSKQSNAMNKRISARTRRALRARLSGKSEMTQIWEGENERQSATGFLFRVFYFVYKTFL